MNRIKTLTARNLKAQTFSLDLAPVNIVTGKNYSGKTAVLTAIRLALLGSDPNLGKTGPAIFAACGCPGGGATSLTVSAIMQDGADIARMWTMKKGKVTYTGPEDEYIPPVMLDPTTFFSLTGPARLNYVLSQVDLGEMGISETTLIAKLNEATPAGTEATAAAQKAVIAAIQAAEVDRALTDGSIYDWLNATVIAITSRFSGPPNRT
jgi:hypothetical protein